MTESVEMAVGQEDGYVVIEFHEPQKIIKFEPQNCIDVAMAMTDAAFEARDGVKPAGETLKAELIERHRMTCTQRGANILNSLRSEITVSNGKLAQDIVEMVLKEVF